MCEIETLVETAIYADDLDLAEEFYVGVLGLPLVGKESGRHVFFRVGTSNVLLVFDARITSAGDRLPRASCAFAIEPWA